MFLRKKLEKIISQFSRNYFKRNKARVSKIDLQSIKIEGLGDYTTRAFFKISEKELKNFTKDILKTYRSVFSDIQLKNGFTNFFINDQFLVSCFFKYIKKDHAKLLNIGRNKKIIMEFFSANPTGRLHIGNARGGLLGDMLANLLQITGFKVWREYYLQNALASKQIEELGKSVLGIGSQYASDYLESIVKKIKKLDSQDPAKIGQKVANKIFEEQKKLIEKKLNIHFDQYFEEQQLYKDNDINKTFRLLKKSALIFLKNGAWFLDSKKIGLPKDRAIIRQDKKPTYILVDLAYHLNKLVKRKFYKAINIWGADHQGHLLDLEAILRFLKLDDRFQTILTHMVLLQTEKGPQKLSKRLGTLVDLEEFVDEFGIEATRFFLAKYDPKKEIVLNLKLMKERSFNNPLYYLQYSAVRAKHIIAKINGDKAPKINLNALKITLEERLLIRDLIDFDDVITQSSSRLLIHPLVDQVLKLSERFNNFYEKCPVLQAKEATKNFRLLLTQKFLETITMVFRILNISLPDRM